MNRTEHLLTVLAEECAEVQQAIAKALRFGLDDGYPGAESTNAQEVFGIIWYKDGTWSERFEYDGAETWVYKSVPTIPNDLNGVDHDNR